VVLRASPLPNFLFGLVWSLVALAFFPLIGGVTGLFLGLGVFHLTSATTKALKKTPQLISDSQGVLSCLTSSSLLVSTMPSTHWLYRRLGLVQLDVKSSDDEVVVFSDLVRLPV